EQLGADHVVPRTEALAQARGLLLAVLDLAIVLLPLVARAPQVVLLGQLIAADVGGDAFAALLLVGAVADDRERVALHAERVVLVPGILLQLLEQRLALGRLLGQRRQRLGQLLVVLLLVGVDRLDDRL